MAEISPRHMGPIRVIGGVRAASHDLRVGRRHVLIRRRRPSCDGCVDLFGPETRFTGPNSQTKAANSGHSRCSTPTMRDVYFPANQWFSGHQTPRLKIVVSPVRFRVSPPPELAANSGLFAFHHRGASRGFLVRQIAKSASAGPIEQTTASFWTSDAPLGRLERAATSHRRSAQMTAQPSGADAETPLFAES